MSTNKIMFYVCTLRRFITSDGDTKVKTIIQSQQNASKHRNNKIRKKYNYKNPQNFQTGDLI